MKIDEKRLKLHEERRKELEALNFPQNKVYLVTGMHRSGTSFLARALYDQGVYLGEPEAIIGPNFHNPLGHWENAHFNHLSDRLLIEAGGGWDKVPPQSEIDTLGSKDDYQQKVKNVIGIHQKKFWGWKDPRLAITGKHFLKNLQEEDVYLIASFRRPHMIADSLARRNHKLFKASHDLTQEYNKRLLRTIKQFVGLSEPI